MKNKENGNSYLQNETKFRFPYPFPPPPRGSFRHRHHHLHHVQQQQKLLKEKEFQQNLTAKPLVLHHYRSRLQQHQQQRHTQDTKKNRYQSTERERGISVAYNFFKAVSPSSSLQKPPFCSPTQVDFLFVLVFDSAHVRKRRERPSESASAQDTREKEKKRRETRKESVCV